MVLDSTIALKTCATIFILCSLLGMFFARHNRFARTMLGGQFLSAGAGLIIMIWAGA